MKKWLLSIMVMGFVLSPAISFASITSLTTSGFLQNSDLYYINRTDTARAVVTVNDVTAVYAQVYTCLPSGGCSVSIYNNEGLVPLSSGTGVFTWNYITQPNYHSIGYTAIILYDIAQGYITEYSINQAWGYTAQIFTESTTSEKYILKSIAFGQTLIYVLMLLGFIGYIFNSFINKKKKPWNK